VLQVAYSSKRENLTKSQHHSLFPKSDQKQKSFHNLIELVVLLKTLTLMHNVALHFFIIKNKLRTIPASAEEQSLKFSIKVVNKTAANAA